MIYNELVAMADRIGNGASVEVQLLRYIDMDDMLGFRASWPGNHHFQIKISLTRLFAQPKDISKIVIYSAQKEYKKLLEGKDG
jgi:hypothetical protein